MERFLLFLCLALSLPALLYSMEIDTQQKNKKKIYIAAWVVNKENDIKSTYDVFRIKDHSWGAGNSENRNPKFAIDYFSMPFGQITKPCSPSKVITIASDEQLHTLDFSITDEEVGIKKRRCGLDRSHIAVVCLTLIALKAYNWILTYALSK